MTKGSSPFLHLARMLFRVSVRVGVRFRFRVRVRVRPFSCSRQVRKWTRPVTKEASKCNKTAFT